MTNNVAIESREIRVFLSSTFRDMDEERTYLVKQVFPKVRAACLERQVGFSEIDLRWGVSEEEAKNGATVEICLKEINRCRDFPPFFIGFLGERYGWVPKHDELAAYWESHSDSEFAPAIRAAVERGISVTELEMELAVLAEGAAEKIADHALFCLRDSGLTDALYAKAKAANPKTREADFYDAGQGKLDILKGKIRQSGFLGLDNYTHVEQFGAAIEAYLLAQLDHYFPADKVPTALQRSNAAHVGFRFHRLQNFLPRADVRDQMIQAINQRIDAPSLGPILVTGPSGQGKSALMADLARHYQTQLAKEWRVIDHYIGADNANHLEGWVDRVLQTLHPDIQNIAGDIPASPNDKVEALSTWISMAARRNNCRYLFILDALDQLSDGGKKLDILSPQTLGPDCILIASAADDTPAQTATANWQTFIKVPPLTNKLRTQLVTDTLARYRKRLPKNLSKKLASAPQSGSPLFLGLALEELRVDARHETLAHITSDILKQPDAEQLFLNRFLLDADNGRPELPELAACFMALLGAAKAGLSENELAELLVLPIDRKKGDANKPRLPQIHLSRLLNNLAPFLLNKQGRRAPMHRILGKAALEYYGTAPVRKHLYAYFSPGYGKHENKFEARGAAEALYQITELAMREHAKQNTARNQLINDIGYLPVPVKLLHDVEQNDVEEFVLEAINLATKNKQDRKLIESLWAKVILKLNDKNMKNDGASIRSFGNWLRYWAQYQLALNVLEPLIKQQESLLTEEHEEIANTSSSLGSLFKVLALFNDAMPLLRRALVIREKNLGPEHLSTAVSLNNLAALLEAQGDYAGAEPLYRRALTIKEKSLGPKHASTATSINNLAGLLKAQGNYVGAEPLYRRALAIREKSLGPEHPSTAESLNNLAVLQYVQLDYAGAEPLYRRALAIREKSLGPKHPTTAVCLNNLAVLLKDQGDYVCAEPLYRRALEITENVLGPDHPDTATRLNNIARLLKDKGDYAGAEPLYRRALEIWEQFLGPDHPVTAKSLNNIAVLLGAQGDYLGAEPLLRRALAIREKTGGEENEETLRVLHDLVVTLRKSGELDKAEPLQRQSVVRHINVYGENGLKTSAAYNGLGALLKLKGELAEAEIYYRKALEIRERELGVDAEPTKLVRKRLDDLLNHTKLQS